MRRDAERAQLIENEEEVANIYDNRCSNGGGYDSCCLVKRR